MLKSSENGRTTGTGLNRRGAKVRRGTQRRPSHNGTQRTNEKQKAESEKQKYKQPHLCDFRRNLASLRLVLGALHASHITHHPHYLCFLFSAFRFLLFLK